MVEILQDLANRLRRLDVLVLVPMLLLTSVGVFLIHSATASGLDLHVRQVRWILIGLIVSLPFMLLPYRRVLAWSPLLYFFGLASLIGVLLFDPMLNDARRWIIIGGQQVQPSEFMKVVTVLLLAQILRFGRELDNPTRWVLPLMVAVVPAGLIVVQPDLGTSLLFAPVAFAVLVVCGVSGRALLWLTASALLFASLAFNQLEDYQRERIWSTYNQDRLTPAQRAGPGYQLTQSLLAISNGGAVGHGHRDGPMTQAGLLPLDYNDFIFAVLAEEHGFLGCLLVVLLYVFLVLAIFRVAWQTRDPAGRLICVGIGAFLGFQSLVHMAVTMGLAPTTGMPLPLVSYGGSSFVVTMIGLAFVQNVAINRPRTPILGLGAD